MYKYRLYIKPYRKLRKLSQEKLAEKCGVDRSYISKLEQDNITRAISPRLSFILILAESLDVCPNSILRLHCEDCLRFNKCKQHEHLEDDTTYIAEHLEYYI